MTHKAYASGSSGPVRWYMDAINLANGQEREGFPVQLQGSAQNQPGPDVQPEFAAAAPGPAAAERRRLRGLRLRLRLQHLAGLGLRRLDRRAKSRRAGSPSRKETAPASGSRARGLFSDGPEPLMFSTGNGGTPLARHPRQPRRRTRWASRSCALAVQANGELKPTDFFAPFDAARSTEWDADFASGGITGLHEPILRDASVTAPCCRGRQGRLRLPAQPRRTRRLSAGPGRTATRWCSGSGPTAASGRVRESGPATAAGCTSRRHRPANPPGGSAGLLRRLPIRRLRRRHADALAAGESSDSFGFGSGRP